MAWRIPHAKVSTHFAHLNPEIFLAKLLETVPSANRKLSISAFTGPFWPYVHTSKWTKQSFLHFLFTRMTRSHNINVSAGAKAQSDTPTFAEGTNDPAKPQAHRIGSDDSLVRSGCACALFLHFPSHALRPEQVVTMSLQPWSDLFWRLFKRVVRKKIKFRRKSQRLLAYVGTWSLNQTTHFYADQCSI